MLKFDSIFKNFQTKNVPLSLVLEQTEQDMLQSAQERREKDEWNLEKLHSGDLGECAHALYTYLVKEGVMDPEENDVYDIIPIGWELDMREFTTSDFEDKWLVGSEWQVQNSAESSVEEFIKEHGYSGFKEGFVLGFIDNDTWNRWVREFFEEDAYNDPEAYLDETDRLPNDKQEQFLMFYNLKAEKLKKKMDTEGKTEELMKEFEDVVEKIENIYQNPLGEYDEDKLDEKIDNRYSIYENDPEGWFGDYYGGTEDDYTEFLERNDFIDRDEVVSAVIESDGYGNILNHYDGTQEEVMIGDEIYYIFPNDVY